MRLGDRRREAWSWGAGGWPSGGVMAVVEHVVGEELLADGFGPAMVDLGI